MLWKLIEGVFSPPCLENVQVHRIPGYLSKFMATPEPMDAHEQRKMLGNHFGLRCQTPSIPTLKDQSQIFARQTMHLPQLPDGL